MKHLLAAISGHGYGHLAQTAPVINALDAACSPLRVTVRSALPQAVLRSRIRAPFVHWERSDDLGLIQKSALDVDLRASGEAYRRLHARWDSRVEATAAELRALGPDLVFADVPYLTLAAAARAGIPAVALCSLNWADIYRHYFGADAIHAEILAAYRSAQLFLRPEPSMPMADIGQTRGIGPVIEAGRERRKEIDRRLQLEAGDRLVLVALGGIRARLPIERWPRLPRVRWLVQSDWRIRHRDAVPLERLEMPFSDILASADLLITKPGYGSFAEAAACGLPVAYIPRGDWPEQPYLTRWLEHRGHSAVLNRTAAEKGTISEVVGGLLVKGRYARVEAAGVAEAADWVRELIGA